MNRELNVGEKIDFLGCSITRETPDSWIERQLEDSEPNHDDCVCEPEQCVTASAIEEMESWEQRNPEGEQ